VVWLSLSLLVVCSAVVVASLWFWGSESGEVEDDRPYVRLVLASSDPKDVARHLQERGLVTDIEAFYWYQRVFLPSAVFEPGAHLVPRQASPREIVRLLARHRSRGGGKVLIPEGFDSFQIAERLEKSGVCASEDFRRAVFDEAMARHELGASSYEGYLHPATYEFSSNTDAVEVRRRLLEPARRQFRAVFDANADAARKWTTEFGFDEHDLVTLASVVQKETAAPEEMGTIASVFRNRLRDESFRPRRALQSDPTAGYGCKLVDAPDSCRGFSGRITPGLLKDASNRYNTYKHPGLPPGPICSPGAELLRRVLQAPATEYYYFYATGGGRHVFSRSYDEHRAAVSRGASPAD
jgi:UPF0755 protein